MLLLGFVARANKGDFKLSEEINDAVWAPVEQALGMVYPEGNITHTMLAKYLELWGQLLQVIEEKIWCW